MVHIQRIGLTLYFTVGLSIGISPPLSGQWIAQNSTTSEALHAVSFPDSLSGWAAGDRGTILHTTNSGIDWHAQNSGTGLSLLGISFSDTSRGWAVGGGSIVLRTSDAGRHWQTIWLDTSNGNYFSKVQSFSPASAVLLEIGFAGDFYYDRAVWITRDTGITWTKIVPPWIFGDEFFESDSCGWLGGCIQSGAATYYYVDRTVDGGTTWQQGKIVINASPYNTIRRLYFSGQQGWATDGSTLYHSTNFGLDWDSVYTGPLGGLTDLIVFGDTGYTSSQYGSIRCTVNGGRTWSTQSPMYIQDMEFKTPLVGWAVGPNGSIYHTANGGGLTAIRNGAAETPVEFQLFQNWPNPFNPLTTIRYQLPHSTNVVLVVCNLLGQRVATLVDGQEQPGVHSVGFDASRIASGVYFYTLYAGDRSETKKLVIQK